MGSDLRTRIGLAGILVAAIALRFVGIGDQNLWCDEIWSLNLATWPIHTLLTVPTGHPPLYQILEKGMLVVVDLDIAGRILSAIFGVAAVLLMFVLGKRLMDEHTGLLAALLTAISPLHLWYSREGRMYALLIVFSIASSWFVKSIAERSDVKSYLAFALMTLGGLLTHYAYVGVLVAQGLFFAGTSVARLPRGRRRFVVASAGIAILVIAIVPMVAEITRGPLGPTREFGLSTLAYTGFAFVAGFSIGPSVAQLHRDVGLSTFAADWPQIAGVAVVGIAAGLFAIRAVMTRGVWATYCAAWLITPLLVVAAGSLITGVAFNVRYVVTALPAFLLLVAAGLSGAPVAIRRIMICALLLCAGISTWNDRFDSRYAREDLRSAAAYLDEHANPQDPIIVSAFYLRDHLRHYLESPQEIYRIVASPVFTREHAQQVETVQLQPPQGSIWFVFSRDWEEDPEGFLMERLDAGLTADEVREFPGVRLYRFDA